MSNKIKQMVFTEDLGFEGCAIYLRLNTPYEIIMEDDNLYYIYDDIENMVCFSKDVLDSTIRVEEVEA